MLVEEMKSTEKSTVAVVLDTGFIGKFIVIGINLNDDYSQEKFDTKLVYMPNGSLISKCSSNKNTFLKEISNCEELGLDSNSISYIKPVQLNMG